MKARASILGLITVLASLEIACGHQTAVGGDMKPSPVVTSRCAPKLHPVRGRVLAAQGGALHGTSLVAFIEESAADAATMVMTAADGSFEACVPSGRVAITATSADDGPAFLPPATLSPGRPVLVKLTRSVAVVEGRVASQSGFATPCYAKMVRMSQDLGDIFYVPVSADGTFRANLFPGYDYRLQLSGSLASEVSKVSTKKVSATSVALNGYPSIVVKSDPDDASMKWLRTSVVPFKTTVPIAKSDDLMPVVGLVGDARIVGLGEGTHGTREHFQLKDRIWRFLAEHMGFAVFMMEVGFAEGLAVNEYVHGGGGNAESLVADLGYWPWDAREVVDLIEWMRRYNAEVKDGRRLEFVGVDMQYSHNAYGMLVAFLTTVDSAAADELKRDLEPLSAENPNAYFELAPEVRDRISKAAGKVVSDLDAKKTLYMQRGKLDERSWQKVRQLAVVVHQAVELYNDETRASRDKSMANNAVWAINWAGENARGVYWAHNAHVATKKNDFVRPAGSFLREQLGDKYLAIAMLFGHGTFRAWDTSTPGDPELSIVPIVVGRSPRGYIDRVLGTLGVPDFMLDLRPLRGSTAKAPWLGVPHSMRIIGAAFSSTEDATDVLRIQDAFDALFYVDVSSATAPTAAGLGGPRSR